MARKAREKREYGDFQTPLGLARQAMSVVADLIQPRSIVEPTCGKGAFLLAAAELFKRSDSIIGADRNEHYLEHLEKELSRQEGKNKARLILNDFFRLNWKEVLTALPDPVLITGNPPWVTSSELGLLQSSNLPEKSNYQARKGLDAVTGKSNFDISEWMLLKHLEWLGERRGMIAVLCKTAVARKILFHAWRQDLRIGRSRIYSIDAKAHFNASVDACFFVIDMMGGPASKDCLVYDDLTSYSESQIIGYRDGMVLADVKLYEKWKHLKGNDAVYQWRSGIKHDCSAVMELEKEGRMYRNGTGKTVDIEPDHVFPMLKSSDIGNGEVRIGRKYMLVTQRAPGEDTSPIRKKAPKTWRYLELNQESFAKRASSIYRDRPQFSIFGVGDYSFSPWKVAISGFYKRLSFKAIGPHADKPIVLDDTIYFLPCRSEREAKFVAGLLNSQPALDFFNSMIFWQDKRPVTIEILRRLNLHSLSAELGKEQEYLRYSRLHRDRVKEGITGQVSSGTAVKAAECRAGSRTSKDNQRSAVAVHA